MHGIGSVCRACKSILSKRHPDKKSSLNNAQAQEKLKPIGKVLHNEETMNAKMHILKHNGHGMHEDTSTPRGYENYLPSPLSIPSQLSRAASTSQLRSASHFSSPLSRSSRRRSQTPSRNGPANLFKSLSWRSVDSTRFPAAGSLSKNASRRNSTTIMYSNSNGLLKPPAMEKQLECTLEELCFGCIKKIKITRDVLTNNGQIIQEDEVLTIKVKPGWRKGTKITFDGMGNERPGTHPADVTFVIAEKQHHLFKKGDDLELGIELPLVKALTGSTLLIPLLGGKHMSLTMEDIICPGSEKIIAGQGMALPKEPGKRGNLIIRFVVEFPEELTEEQRSDVHSILHDSC